MKLGQINHERAVRSGLVAATVDVKTNRECQTCHLGLIWHTDQFPSWSNDQRKGYEMTSTTEVNIDEALALIDQGLGLTMSRDLMSTNEVADLLLDVRTLLAASAPADEEIVEPIPAAIS